LVHFFYELSNDFLLIKGVFLTDWIGIGNWELGFLQIGIGIGNWGKRLGLGLGIGNWVF
jgi:hypothetical protein